MKSLILLFIAMLCCLFSFAQISLNEHIVLEKYCEGDEYALVKFQGDSDYTYSWDHSDDTTAFMKIKVEDFGKEFCVIGHCPCGSDYPTCFRFDPELIRPEGSGTQIETIDASCNKADDGAAFLTSIGGGGFDYQWSDGTTGRNVQDLMPGKYSVTATDALGCTEKIDFEIDEPEAVDTKPIEIETYATSCYEGGNGRAKINLTKGNLKRFDFKWENGENTTEIEDLEAGNHQLQVKAKGDKCSLVDFKIDQPEPLEMEHEITSDYNGYPLQCYDSEDGAVKLSIKGGASSYQVKVGRNSYSDIDLNEAINQQELGAGTHTVFVTDANGCQSTFYFDIKGPASISAAFDLPALNGYHIDCYGERNGRVNVSPEGGTGGYGYEWTKGGQLVSNDPNLSKMGAGKYHLKISDQNGCEMAYPIEIKQPRNLRLKTKRIAKNRLFSIVSVRASGGVKGYSINGKESKSKLLISFKKKKQYEIEVVDDNECSKEIKVSQSKKYKKGKLTKNRRTPIDVCPRKKKPKRGKVRCPKL